LSYGVVKILLNREIK